MKVQGVHSSTSITTITVIIVIAALIVDTFSLKVYDFYSKDPTSTLRISVFIIITVVYCIGQYVILKFVKAGKEIKALEVLHFHTLHNIIIIMQYILTAILVYNVLQVVLTSQYSTASISIATTISCVLACSMLVLLTWRFFSWFKTNRDPIVFLYGLSSAILAITTVILFVFVDVVLASTKPDSIMPKVGGTGLFIAPGTINGLLDNTYIIFSILSFVLIWSATSMLLRHHSSKIGSVKYWVVVTIPLVYFASQFFSLLFNVFVPLLRSDPVFYGIVLTFIFTFSKLVGGIFFGIAFWIIARSIRQDNIVRKYMIISAYGLILLFISYQVNGIVVTSYPPFGLVTILFMGLASYLILVGIYSAAISVSEDTKLRQSIRKIAIEESRLLDSIGSAEMQQQIEKRIIASTRAAKYSMTEQSGIESSLTEEDVKQYVEKVLREIKGQKGRGSESQ